MRIVFDPAEQEALRADARDQAHDDPHVAYVLERLASEGIDLDVCKDWEDLRIEAGLPPRSTDTPHVA